MSSQHHKPTTSVLIQGKHHLEGGSQKEGRIRNFTNKSISKEDNSATIVQDNTKQSCPLLAQNELNK